MRRDATLRTLARRKLRSSERLYTTVKRGGTLATYLARRPHERLSGRGVLLNIGANSGQSALSLRIFNRHVPILSLEPNPACEGELRFVRRLIRRFDYAMVAAGDRCGTAVLNVPRVRKVAVTVAASLDSGFILRRRHEIERQAGGAPVLSEVQVPAVTVDRTSWR